MSNNLNLAEALEAALASMISEIHTTFPAQVVSYDKNNQTATLRPMVKKPILAADINDTEDEYETLPQLPNVPVSHPRGGNTHIHVPLREGDFVWVHVCQSDISSWRTTGRLSDPTIPLTHHLSSVWAEPGAFHDRIKLDGSKLSDNDITIVNGDMIVTVKDDSVHFNGNSDAAALASKVDALQNNLNNFINVFNAHTHAGVTPGSGTTAISTTPATPSSETFASARIKCDS